MAVIRELGPANSPLTNQGERSILCPSGAPRPRVPPSGARSEDRPVNSDVLQVIGGVGELRFPSRETTPFVHVVPVLAFFSDTTKTDTVGGSMALQVVVSGSGSPAGISSPSARGRQVHVSTGISLPEAFEVLLPSNLTPGKAFNAAAAEYLFHR
ncbi:hypothetical protein B296_00009533 [Ensete ventricosum]|uniref:Uncharacterized protein n=1 Tax=Ensete ventricosum TaxID=4639 RepID=A0A426ZJH1_ENSVE|nr:hypothetical protein B296_00009533 [Ensete ventricosum]